MDRMRRRGALRRIGHLAWINLDMWMHSPRTIVMALFVLSECIMLMRGLAQMSVTYFEGAKLRLVEMLVYRMAEGCNLPVMSVLLLVTVHEIPRRISFQSYALLRSDKGKWLASQVLYCLMMVMCMLAAVTAFMAVCAIPSMDGIAGWSDLQRIEAGEAGWGNTVIDSFLIQTFSPGQALLFCAAPLGLFWLTMMLVILLFGLLGFPVFGTVIYYVMLVAHMLFMATQMEWIRFPSAFATFKSIVSGHEGEEMAAMLRAFGGYAAAIALLLLLMRFIVSRVDFDFDTQNRV